MTTAASVDPRLALGAACLAMGIALASRAPAAPLCLAAVALPLALVGKGRPARPWRALLAPLGLGLTAAALRAWLTPGPAAIALSVHGQTLELSRAGLEAGGLIVARVMAATSIAFALATRIPFAHLLAALRAARVPIPILEILRIAERQRHALGDAAAQVIAARSLRLGFSTPPRRLASLGAITGAVLCRAIDQACAVAEAMALRGSNGIAGLSLPPRCARADARFVALVLPPLAVGLGLALLDGRVWR